MYFAGTVTHSLDFRKSSGGWILNWIIKNNLFYFIKINLTLALLASGALLTVMGMRFYKSGKVSLKLKF